MTPLELAQWIGAEVAVVVAMAAITTRAPARAGLGGLVVAGGLVLPWLAPDDRIVRFWMALGSTLGAMIYVRLARDRHTPSLPVRVWMSITPADVRLAKRVSPRLDARGAAMTLVYLGLAGVGWFLTYRVAPELDGAARWALRWGAGLLYGYCIFDGVVHLLRVGYRAIGVELPKMHELPAASRTVSEFWAHRWNQTVHQWLRTHCFWPWARRRRPGVGVAVAFVVSALIHAWIFLVPLGVVMAALALGYFLVQGALVLAEQWLGVARWRPGLQRAWTVTWMVVTAPLFIEPFLRLLE